MGYKIGLVDEARYKKYLKRRDDIEKELNRIKSIQITPKKEVIDFLSSLNSSELKKSVSLYELIKRPELNYFNVGALDVNRPELSEDVKEEVNIISKYEGYISKQLEQVAQFKKLENKVIPLYIEYDKIKGLRIEAMQKLNKIRPMNVGQASRISGVSPADISVLLIYMEKRAREKNL
jgi:tRNA uridine 5-carboxymethylaminomethyl modification enzyme